MRKIYIIIISVVFLSTGCTDFLLLEPQDELIREEYWKTEGDVVAVLGTSYALMSEFLEEIYLWSEIRGGLLSPNENRPSIEQMDFFNFNINENNELVQWAEFYQVINLANTIIEYAHQALDNDDTFTEDRYSGYVAEAYFIRSLCYFYLVKTFKEVPFITKSYDTDSQDFRIEKSTENEILEQLIEDLLGIVGGAFEQDDFVLNTEKKGRATTNAIYSLLADIYLWKNDYVKCLETCDKINNIYLVEGDEYFSLYGDDGNSQESIFELQFDYDLYRTSNSLYSITSNSSDGNRDFLVSEMLLGLYVETDLRFIAPQSSIYPAGGEVSINTNNYSIWKYVGMRPRSSAYSNNERTKKQSDANWIFYRLADIYLMKAEAYAELGEYENSLLQLNVIKNRAGLKNFPFTSDQKGLLNEILKERAREFVGEGKRWYDLVRISRRDQANRLSFISDAVISNVEPTSRSAVVSKIKEVNSWFLPIYYNELILNNLLEQNIFYKTN